MAEREQPRDELTTRLGQGRNEVDRQSAIIIQAFADRFRATDEIGQIKRALGLPLHQPKRFKEMLEEIVSYGTGLGLDPAFLETLFSETHKESLRRQEGL